jgi:glycerol dehydrogenase-like iron-containing ADH family enzyme
VYIVDSLLDMAPKGYNRFGLIDVFSIYTALADWDIAVSKGKATLALEYYFAKSILDTCLYSNLDMENYYDVVKLLWHSGLVVGMYGDGRPESGSEHIIAKAIESKIDCFHVHSVSFGMLVAMKLQGTWREDIVKLIVDISDWGSEYGKQTLKQIEDHLLSEDIHFRLGRYTVLDMVDGVRIQNMINEVIEYLRHDLRL